MTKKVIIKPSGKVDGIRGLYKDCSSGRWYVRLSFHGIDKQVTIECKNETFSGLERAAGRALRILKKEVESISTGEMETNKRNPALLFSNGEKALQNAIKKRWTLKGTSEKKIKEYMRHCSGLVLCENKHFASTIDAHNVREAQGRIYNDGCSNQSREERFCTINTVFKQLILCGVHKGSNPCDSIPKPKHCVNRRLDEFTFERAAEVIKAIREQFKNNDVRRDEHELFFRLCFETGQRPKDVYLFDARDIKDGHYHFSSHKTERFQRVSHKLSNEVMELTRRLIDARKSIFFSQRWKNEFVGDEVFECFWETSFAMFSRALNNIIHKLYGPSVSLYYTRHFFVSEVFRITGSEFWAEAFTHEGRNANEIHYLHPDQEKADEILIEYQRRLSDVSN